MEGTPAVRCQDVIILWAVSDADHALDICQACIASDNILVATGKHVELQSAWTPEQNICRQ